MVTSTHHFGIATRIVYHVLRFCKCISTGEHTKHQNLNPYLNRRAKEIAICYGRVACGGKFQPPLTQLGGKQNLQHGARKVSSNRPVKFISSLCTAEKKRSNRCVAQQICCSTLQLNRSKKMLSSSHKTFLLYTYMLQ